MDMAGLEDGNQAQAELTAEREQETERALLFVLHLYEQLPQTERDWTHLAVLCRECGVSYQMILNRGLGH